MASFLCDPLEKLDAWIPAKTSNTADCNELFVSCITSQNSESSKNAGGECTSRRSSTSCDLLLSATPFPGYDRRRETKEAYAVEKKIVSLRQ